MAAKVTAIAVFGVAVALGAASLPLASLARQATDRDNNVAEALLTLVLAGVGLLVAWHRPRNLIGWVLLVSGVCFVLDGDASLYDTAVYLFHHGRLPLGWVAVLVQPSWAPAIALLGTAVLLFPDGQVLSRQWRWPLRLYLAVAALWVGGAFAISAAAIAGHRIRLSTGGDLAILDHPTGAAALWGLSQDAFFTLLFGCGVACVIQQAVSYRRASGERRQQLKWAASGIAVCGACGVVTLELASKSGIAQVVSDVAVVGIAALPASMAVAILRYRLYDIDRIISRTLAYAIVTGLLVGVYAGLVPVASQVLDV
jgi:hypothetical protein